MPVETAVTPCKLVDVGGSSGSHASAMIEARPDIRAAVFERTPSRRVMSVRTVPLAHHCTAYESSRGGGS